MRSEQYGVLLARGAKGSICLDFVCFCAREGDYKESENAGHVTCFLPTQPLTTDLVLADY
jgi:hypothetical protein